MRHPNLKAAEEAALEEARAKVAAQRKARFAQLRDRFFPGFTTMLRVEALSDLELDVIAANAGKKDSVDVSGKDNEHKGVDQDTVDFLLGELKDAPAEAIKELSAAIKAEKAHRAQPREKRAL